MPVKVVKDRTLESARRERLTGVMVGANGSGGVGMARLVDGVPEWREDWDPGRAESIGKELVRFARMQRDAASRLARARRQREMRRRKAAAS